MKNTKSVCVRCDIVILYLFFIFGSVNPEECEQCECIDRKMTCINVTAIPLSDTDTETLVILGYNFAKLFNEPSSFLSLKTLVALHCEFNNINNEFFTKEELYYLDISYSVVKFIAEEPFQNNLKLELIHLNFNNISRIPKNIFSAASEALSISLKGNKLTEVYKGTFSANRKLTKLDLSQNTLDNIEENAFNISDVEFSFKDKEVVLNISHNRLVKLVKGTFSLCHDVTLLDLSHNRLTSLHPSSMEGLNTLRTLLLVNNRLTMVNGVLPSIRELNVSANCLWELQRGARLYLQELDEKCQNLLGRFLSEEGLNETDCREYVVGNCVLECDDEGTMMEYCVLNSSGTPNSTTFSSKKNDKKMIPEENDVSTSRNVPSSTKPNSSGNSVELSSAIHYTTSILLPIIVLMYERTFHRTLFHFQNIQI